ncbi:TPA: hypothetical protein ACH3X2_005977 [Trebouxia sp. C0005]
MCATSLCQVCLALHLTFVNICKSIHIRLYTDKDEVTRSFRYFTKFLFDDVCLSTSQRPDETTLGLVRLLECIDIPIYPCLRQLLKAQPDKRASAAHAVQCAFLSSAA